MFFQRIPHCMRMVSVAAAIAIASLASKVSADEFPDQPITILVGYGPGGMTDLSTRILAERLEEILGVGIIVENRPGAGGTLAWSALLDRPADGYTIVDFGSSAYVTSLMLDREIGLEDFQALGSIMEQQRVLFARKEMPFDTLEGMIEYARETPVTFADGGAFWASRVMEAMNKQFDLKIRLVPFRSGAEGSAAIMGGHVSLAETGVGTGAWLTATREGTLNILGVLSPGNLDRVGQSGIRSVADVGADYTVRMYYGYAVKAGTPEDRVARLSAAIQQALTNPGTEEKFQERDLIPEWIAADEYSRILNDLTEEAQALKAYLAE